MVSNKQKQVLLPSLTKLISFNFIDISFTLRERTLLREWIILSIKREKKEVGYLSFNFCSDKYLLKTNKQYLNHDYYTDIITFDLCEGNNISGDIYISIDRVKENASKNNSKFHVELKRVIIHGVLHLIGYKDKTREESSQMRKKEDFYLSLWTK